MPFDERWALVEAVDAWFDDASAAEATYGHISTWDTSAVTDMSELFCYAEFCSHTRLEAQSFDGNVSAWDTSSVARMDLMFRGAEAFNAPVGGWDTARVVATSYMFRGASAFDRDIGAWDTAKLASAVQMFYAASSYNADLASWDTSALSDLREIFVFAASFDQALGWPVDVKCGAFFGTKCEADGCGVDCAAADDAFRHRPRPEDAGDEGPRPDISLGGFFASVFLSLLAACCFIGYKKRCRWHENNRARVHPKWGAAGFDAAVELPPPHPEDPEEEEETAAA